MNKPSDQADSATEQEVAERLYRLSKQLRKEMIQALMKDIRDS